MNEEIVPKLYPAITKQSFKVRKRSQSMRKLPPLLQSILTRTHTANKTSFITSPFPSLWSETLCTAMISHESFSWHLPLYFASCNSFLSTTTCDLLMHGYLSVMKCILNIRYWASNMNEMAIYIYICMPAYNI